MTENEKLEICKQCDNYFYEVFPNLYWCRESNNAIHIVVTEENCTIGKW